MINIVTSFLIGVSVVRMVGSGGRHGSGVGAVPLPVGLNMKRFFGLFVRLNGAW